MVGPNDSILVILQFEPSNMLKDKPTLCYPFLCHFLGILANFVLSKLPIPFLLCQKKKLRGLRKSEGHAEQNPQDARPGMISPPAPAIPKRVADT